MSIRLNDEEKYTIQELDKDGIEAEDIAYTIGVTKRTVDNYIRNIRLKKKGSLVRRRCHYCDNEFFALYRRHYCSDKCRLDSMRKEQWSKEATVRYYTDKLNELQAELARRKQ